MAETRREAVSSAADWGRSVPRRGSSRAGPRGGRVPCTAPRRREGRGGRPERVEHRGRGKRGHTGSRPERPAGRCFSSEPRAASRAWSGVTWCGRGLGELEEGLRGQRRRRAGGGAPRLAAPLRLRVRLWLAGRCHRTHRLVLVLLRPGVPQCPVWAARPPGALRWEPWRGLPPRSATHRLPRSQGGKFQGCGVLVVGFSPRKTQHTRVIDTQGR